MANNRGSSYVSDKNVRSKNYIAVPTPALRRLGMFYVRYARNGEWVSRSKYNPRNLPVIRIEFEFGTEIHPEFAVILFVKIYGRYSL